MTKIACFIFSKNYCICLALDWYIALDVAYTHAHTRTGDLKLSNMNHWETVTRPNNIESIGLLKGAAEVFDNP